MHPVLAELPTPWGPLPIYSYGVMLGTSLIVAWYFVMYQGTRKEGLSRDQMANAFITTAVAAIVGARLLFILTNPEEFTSPARWFALREGGLVAYGGFLGGLAGSIGYWVFARRDKPLSALGAWADVVAPTLGLGLLFTRIGCYLFGCDYGAPLAEDAPLWLKNLGAFPGPGGLHEHGSPAFVHHVSQYDLSPTAATSLPVHPTQLYESLAGIALFGVCMLVWRRRRFRGQVVLVLTALYGLWRFLIEYVRDDPERGFYFGFSTSQLISLALVPFAILLYVILQKQQGEAPVVPVGSGAVKKPDAPAPSSAPPDEKKPSAGRKKRKA
jgi:phosphatidylglycerol:prolipoprotein diacylglycerol transferase